MLQLKCPQCARPYRLKPEWAGKAVRCSVCQTKFTVPVPSDDVESTDAHPSPPRQPQTTATTSQNLLEAESVRKPAVVPVSRPRKRRSAPPPPGPDEILATLPQQIPPVRLPLAYLIEMVGVATVMMLLPIVYVSLIGGIGFGVHYYFNHSGWILKWMADNFGNAVKGKAALVLIIAVASPGVIGGILVLFMVKPFFSRRQKREKPIPVQRSEQPLLFDYVDHLCDALQAPRPQQIILTNDVNASAGFTSSWALLTNRLVLTIGMPLVAGMSLRQVTGILSHEFGHFTQFWAMRFGYIIETINAWFHFVADEKDQWDERLDRWAELVDIRVGWILFVSKIFVWLVHHILKQFKNLGIFFSRRLSRQMEFNADEYQTRVSGSEEFAKTFDQLAVLDLANELARKMSSQFLAEGRAIDNFPRFVSFQANELPQEKLQPLLHAVRNRPAEWFSTHPSTAERIARADSLADSGRFSASYPATALFPDFEGFAIEFTRRSYRKGDGSLVKSDELTSVNQLIQEQQQRRKLFDAAVQYGLGIEGAISSLSAKDLELDTQQSGEELVAELQEARNQLVQRRTEYAKLEAAKRVFLAKIEDLQPLRMAVIAKRNASAVKSLQPSWLKQPLQSSDDVDELVASIQKDREDLQARMIAFEKLLALRLLRALQLQRAPTPDSQLGEEIKKLWYLMGVMKPVGFFVKELGSRKRQFEFCFSQLAENPRDQLLQAVLGGIRKGTIAELGEAWGPLTSFFYPFELPFEVPNVAVALLPGLRDENHPLLVYEDVDRFITSFGSLWVRVIGRLVEIAIEAETDAGLPPLGSAQD